MRKQEIFMNRVMTIQEVSQYLRIPVSTIYALTRKGKIRGAKFGKHWRFLEQDILDYLRGEPFAHGAETSRPERRQSPRINTRIPAALVTCLIDQEIKVHGVINNLSESGAYFVTEKPAGSARIGDDGRGVLAVGDPVAVTFEVPDPAVPKMIEVEGRIVRQAANGHLGQGIKFRPLPAGIAEVIHEYVG